jgi:hypothetical protein
VRVGTSDGGHAMEAINKGFEVEVTGQWAKITILECHLELAAGVEATALIFPEYIEHSLDAREGVFGPGRHYKFRLI